MLVCHGAIITSELKTFQMFCRRYAARIRWTRDLWGVATRLLELESRGGRSLHGKGTSEERRPGVETLFRRCAVNGREVPAAGRTRPRPRSTHALTRTRAAPTGPRQGRSAGQPLACLHHPRRARVGTAERPL